MIRRSSMLTALVVMLGVTDATAATKTPLSKKAAKARTMKVIGQERANEFDARSKVGGDFTVAFSYCELKYGNGSKPQRAACLYTITAVNQTSTGPNGEPVRRRCVVNVEVRKSARTGRVTHTRRPGKCYEPQPPVTGPPVGGS